MNGEHFADPVRCLFLLTAISSRFEQCEQLINDSVIVQ
jgi:hypothetical protein